MGTINTHRFASGARFLSGTSWSNGGFLFTDVAMFFFTHAVSPLPLLFGGHKHKYTHDNIKYNNT
uniref:Uncharacterized protein n=1 Tax=Anguilla anguilla TaxID=7936 RepID=A0A0E9W480_ANGAN